ncbi:PspC domain-containing protein [Rhodococcus pyridinivorans]|uniref:PspC domain-containing protein n=1 Tax=Rhodococcus TaxID=1827 RepID=UPI0007EC21DD|nr:MULTISPECIES: PspC domain-containing protein [Rhodococcus]MCW3470337.1 PspC domain-containing protein [Rhodococcus pyridinivorans]OBA33066.1 PspC family transcriptional regulator [Rhodococcus sp. 852002-51564_SCH6189132-a]UVT24592.1 PspC domain-containing protein [Rhodococcus pyridinivorans]
MDTRSFQDQVADMWRTRPVRLPKEGHIAGVCSGIGVRYGVDPVLIRVVFVASALFGGGGLVLYLAAWLMFPRHGDQVSSLESLVGRGASSDSTTKVVVLLVALAIAAGAIGPVGAGSGGSGFIGTLLLLGGWWLLYQRRPEPPVLPAPEGTSFPTQAAFPQPPVTNAYCSPWGAHTGAWHMQAGPAATTTPGGEAAGTKTTSTAATPPAQTTDATEVLSTTDASDTPASGTDSTAPTETTERKTSPMPDLRKDTDRKDTDRKDTDLPLPDVDALSPHRSAPPAWDPLGVAPFAWDLPEPTPTHQPAVVTNRRSRLTTTVLGLAVIAAAVTGALGAAADLAWVTPARVGAAALAVVGLGLLIGAFLHRGHGLLVVTGPLLGFVVLASIAGPVDTSNWGDRTWAPTSTDQLESEYSFQFGAMTLDLRGLELTEDRTVQVDGRFGSVEVLLPENLDVRADCTVGPGEIRGCPAPGIDGGADGVDDGPVLDLNANMEFGSLEVRRG